MEATRYFDLAYFSSPVGRLSQPHPSPHSGALAAPPSYPSNPIRAPIFPPPSLGLRHPRNPITLSPPPYPANPSRPQSFLLLRWDWGTLATPSLPPPPLGLGAFTASIPSSLSSVWNGRNHSPIPPLHLPSGLGRPCFPSYPSPLPRSFPLLRQPPQGLGRPRNPILSLPSPPIFPPPSLGVRHPRNPITLSPPHPPSGMDALAAPHPPSPTLSPSLSPPPPELGPHPSPPPPPEGRN